MKKQAKQLSARSTDVPLPGWSIKITYLEENCDGRINRIS